ncbi:hypothetical protein BDQ12DRAFT_661509 [Crucibulum laeve]|uniref:Uncharacterized protein n=1 Tax=Crucibulum laeve TaxID=68775 RepID=A0A5C3MHI2_9AGAR|nr:hypothetical protein BDQ12DRAFT_661509 [Crucibulum laeve]
MPGISIEGTKKFAAFGERKASIWYRGDQRVQKTDIGMREPSKDEWRRGKFIATNPDSRCTQHTGLEWQVAIEGEDGWRRSGGRWEMVNACVLPANQQDWNAHWMTKVKELREDLEEVSRERAWQEVRLGRVSRGKQAGWEARVPFALGAWQHREEDPQIDIY